MAKVVSVGMTSQHSNGPGGLDSAPTVSPMSTYSEMSTPNQYSSGYSSTGRYSQYSDVFGDDDITGASTPAGDAKKANGQLAPPTTDHKGRLSPIQQIMSYRTPSPVDSTISRSSRRSKDTLGSEMNYGRFYKQSYLKDEPQFKKGPSQNPTDPHKSHFHRPENFSYMNVRKDFNRPMKKGLLSSLGGARVVVGKTHQQLSPVMKNKEAIALSKYPDGHKVEDAPAPIERDDWPAPPMPAAAFPELLRAHDLGKGKANKENEEPNGVEDEIDGEEKEVPVDPKVQKELDELRKVNSGVGKVILKHLEKKTRESPHLDPRSASRTPAADREPMYKTRYQSPIFASPSRDNEFHTRVYSLDDQMIGTKYRTTPFANARMPKPGYGLKISTKPVSKRSEGYVSEGYLTDEDRPVRNYLSMLEAIDNANRSMSTTTTESVNRPTVLVDSTTTPVERRSQRSTSEMDRSQRSTEYDRSDIERRSYYTSQSSVEDGIYDPETGLRRSRYRSSQMSGSHASDYLSGSYLGGSAYRRSASNVYKSDEPPLIYPYEQLRITNPTMPHGTETNSLERHLSTDEFESIFHMTREEFYRLAEWKRNDMKKRVQLY